MARTAGGAPNARPGRDRETEGSTRGRRRTRPGAGANRAWIMPLLLFLLGLLVLVLGLSTECLSLSDSMPGSPGGQVCQTTPALGAVIFAVICWATAIFVWLVGRRR